MISNKEGSNRFEIIATVRSSDFALLSNTINVLLENDITSFRFNASRESKSDTKIAIDQCKAISRKHNISSKILLDLPIPKRKIRTSKLSKPEILVKTNDSIIFYNSIVQCCEKNAIILDFNEPFNLKIGQDVLYADGLGKLIVTQCETNYFVANALNDFKMIENKSCYWGILINSFKEKYFIDDYMDLVKNVHPNSIALSFVETSFEIEQIRNMVAKDIKIMGKIETPLAVNNIKTISSLCDSLMFARGDLGVTSIHGKR